MKAEDLYAVEGIGGGLRYPEVNAALVKALNGYAVQKNTQITKTPLNRGTAAITPFVSLSWESVYPLYPF